MLSLILAIMLPSVQTLILALMSTVSAGSSASRARTAQTCGNLNPAMHPSPGPPHGVGSWVGRRGLGDRVEFSIVVFLTVSLVNGCQNLVFLVCWGSDICGSNDPGQFPWEVTTRPPCQFRVATEGHRKFSRPAEVNHISFSPFFFGVPG